MVAFDPAEHVVSRDEDHSCIAVPTGLSDVFCAFEVYQFCSVLMCFAVVQSDSLLTTNCCQPVLKHLLVVSSNRVDFIYFVCFEPCVPSKFGR